MVYPVTDKAGGTGSDPMTLTVSYRVVGIDITPADLVNPVTLDNPGLLPVAVLSTATFDARQVDSPAGGAPRSYPGPPPPTRKP
jgi:hypothetical protein